MPLLGRVPSYHGFGGLYHEYSTYVVLLWLLCSAGQMSSAAGCSSSTWGGVMRLHFLLKWNPDTGCQIKVIWWPACYSTEYSGLLSAQGQACVQGTGEGCRAVCSRFSRSRNLKESASPSPRNRGWWSMGGLPGSRGMPLGLYWKLSVVSACMHLSVGRV